MRRSMIAAVLALACTVAPARADLASRAETYLGQTARQLGLPPSLWCADFMNMLLGGGTGSRRADSFRTYGSAAAHGCTDCIAVIAPCHSKRWHVGVVAGYDANGNTVIVSGNHNRRVGKGVYPRRCVRAYRQ